MNKLQHDTFVKLKGHYKGDQMKAMDWLNTSNFHLGGRSPMECLKIGNHKSVSDLINRFTGGELS